MHANKRDSASSGDSDVPVCEISLFKAITVQCGLSEWRSAPGRNTSPSRKHMADTYEPQPLPISSQENFHIHIEPTRSWLSFRLKEMWLYRELLFFLTWRDIKIRYKQTVLGFAWAILQPFMMMVVFSLFFGRLGKIPSEGFPYPIFNFAGLLPWNFFEQSINVSTNSLVTNANMVTKVYFPRLFIPISSVLSGLVDFAVAFSVLIGMMLFYQITPTIGILLLPLFILLAFITSMGVSLWMSALNVKYRDVRYIVPFLSRFWFFATPIAYPSTMLSEPWRTLYGLNPMVGVVEGFRWAMLGTNPPQAMIFLSAAISIVLFVTGLIYFNRTEKTFADVI
jgi:lipopolysaccharide transport system permease protein